MTAFPSRRLVLAGAAGFGAGLPARAQTGRIMTKPIPASGEALPVVGIGTSIVFDFQTSDAAKLAERREVVQILTDGGGSLIDTAPSYGNAEVVLGEVVGSGPLRPKAFLATKVAGGAPDAQRAQFQQSLQRMKTSKVELLQWWNVADAAADLGPLRELKAQGLTRYVGVTTSFPGAYDPVEQVVKRQKPDFLQVNYSLGDRGAEARLLPAAQDAGAAVLTNLPFGRNRMFAAVQGKALPEWAAEIDATSWAQFFLKFLISHPAVTAVIPGTDKPQYMRDNLGAGRGRMPDAAMRKRMVDYWATIAP